MSEFANRALLPAGLRDVLPPDAAFEADVVHRLARVFAAHGYQRVKPPLMEFEESLFAGSGAATADQTFRVMDPVSQRMMGLRADMTVQIGRIAATRMAKAPRPLRLSYAGQVLRVKGSPLKPDRQVGQAGIELIGSDAAAADAEVILLAARAMAEAGLGDVSVDLTMPVLVESLLAGRGLDPDRRAALRHALDQKDTAGVSALAGDVAALLVALIAAAGPADRALRALAGLALDGESARARDRLQAVADLVRREAPDLPLTVDPVEKRGFEYYTGVSFAMFSHGARAEVVRGGRYLAGGVEPATGATVSMDDLIAALPPAPTPARVYLPLGTPAAAAARLRRDGMETVAGLEPVADAAAEARRLGCKHLLAEDRLVALTEGGDSKT